MVKRTLIIAALIASGFTASVAQTQTEQYLPGITTEGAIYSLPKTAVRIAVRVEKTTFTPGDFAPYAERFLRLKDVGMEPTTSYRIISVSQSALGVSDSTKYYAIRFNNKTAAINVARADDGVLLALNAEPRFQSVPEVFKPSPKPSAVNPRQYMKEDILAAGSTAKMAQLTAQEIYDIRSSRSELVKGQADFMPQDGEQMKLMLSQLDNQDRALTSLFAGITVKDTTETVLTIIADSAMHRKPLFRFSKHFGLVEADDLSGTPYYISIENLTKLPPVDDKNAKKKKAAYGLYYNVAGRMRSTIYDANKIADEAEFPAGQFGYVELLSADLFNKHYGTRLWLNPVTGGIDRLEAEQPK
jgi:hypothetical protein